MVLVLVEPSGARNVGSVARLCANFGIEQLRLVAPRCDPLGAEARQMAVHGVSHLERAQTFPHLAAALADRRRVVAATGRQEGAPLPLRSPEAALAWLLAPQPPAEPPPQPLPFPLASQTPEGALVFGREDRGLANDELLQAGCLLHISAAATYPSLNLSHAVAVALHTYWRLRQGPGERDPEFRDPGGQDPEGPDPRGQTPAAPEPPASAPQPSGPLAPRGAVEAGLADAEALLLEVGYLLPHTARARMAKLRALLQRAALTENDLALLRGMVCQLRWASRRGGGHGPDH